MAASDQDIQARLKDALLALQKMRARLEALEKARREPIAIIGMGCRFPANINTPEQFWQFLCDHGDAMGEIPRSRWDIDQYYDPDPDAPGKIGTRTAGFIEQPIDRFDAAFFGISPREARSMDPQQRMLLEVAWETLDHAGIAPGRAAGTRTGVYVGMTMQDYLLIQANRLDPGQVDAYHTTGGVLNAAVGRVSYLLGLRGPCMAVDTACSSSLVATHLAVQALRSGECDLALAGGANVILSPEMMVSLTKAHMLAPDGRCKTFDARADGFARSEGCGMVALKRLSAALADGDRVFAVIRGSAVNHGGVSSGFTVPNKLAQAALIRDALKDAGVEPAQIGYVETHGTGTSLGDPIEVRALVDALREGRTADNPLLLGSVKTNFGHLEAGAGIIGLMKLALAAYHGAIPPHLHFETPNPYISWDEMPLQVPTALTPWQGARIGGVSSFGASGTNGHVIVEAGPQAAASEDTPGRAHLLTISAQTEAALRASAEAYRGFLTQAAVPGLHDLTYTANMRRTALDWRLAVTGRSPDEMAAALTAYLNGEQHASGIAGQRTAGVQHRLAFVFSGQGPQWWGMGRELLAQEPVFRERIEACDALLRQHADWSLLAELARPEAESRLDETAIAQPAIFAIQVALAALWRAWGVVPGAVVGHSVGEIAAAHLAGVLSLEDAVRVVYHRARLMQQATGQGQMMTVDLPAAEAEQLLAPFAERLAVAAINSPVSTVLSGEAAALQAVAALMAERGVFHRMLPVNYAFHSPQMEPYQHALARELAGLRPAPAQMLLMSTVTGTRSGESDYTADYWGRNVRQKVCFAPAISELASQGYDTFVEIAPHPVLASVIEQCLAAGEHAGLVLHSLRRHKDERATMLTALGGLYARGGVAVNWAALYPDKGAVVSLPSYPWQRERYWVDLPAAGRRAAAAGDAGELLGQRLRSPGIEDAIFETQFDAQQPAFAADHRVLETVILSGTTYLEMAAEAAAAQGINHFTLADFLVQSPLALAADEACPIQTVVRPGTPAAVEIYSLRHDQWTQHAAGTIEPAAAGERLLPDADLEAARARCPQEARVADLYDEAAARGMAFGPAFRGLERLWLGADEAVGLVSAPAGQPGRYLFHPAQLDACFHAIFMLLKASDAGTFLPVSYGAVRYHARPVGAVYAHTRLRHVEGDTGLADVCVWDEDGALVAEVRGLRFKAVSAVMLDAPLPDWLYQIHWLPERLTAAPQVPAGPAGWLIFADAQGIGAALARRLRAAGAAALVVTPGADLAELEDGLWQIDPREPAHYSGVLRAAQAEDRPALRGVVHLWSLDAPAGIASESQERCVASALLTAQAVVGAGLAAELWLVTRGAQAVNGALTNPVQAAAWGFGAALALEQPELNVICVDLDADAAAGDQTLFEEIARGAHDEPRVAFRQQTRYVARLERGQAGDTPLLAGDQPFTLTIADRGVLDNLTFQAAERRAPGPDEIEIRVHAAGLNFRDVLNALGMYPGDAGLLGNECAGEVVAVGAQVRHVRVGDPVMGIAYGTFSRYVTAPAALAVRIPASLSYEEAATIPVTFLTALYGLQHLAGLKAGDRVLIHAAAGGVGMAAVQLALRAGAEVFGTAGSDAKREFLARLGVQHRLNSRTLDFAEQIMAHTGGVDIVLNSLTGDFIPASLSALASGGHFLEIGKAGIWDAEQMRAARPDAHYAVIYLGDVCKDQPDLIQAMLREIVQGLEDGSLKPLPRTVFPLREAVAAFRYMAQARHIGKVVLAQDARRGQVLADATYLVTGGTSGIGLHVARWLRRQGARHLVLVSRRGATDEALALADEAAAAGAVVRLAACDVSQPAAVSGLFEQVLADLPPLRGIIHCAGINADAPVMQQDAARLAAVMRPKADGALLLAAAARDLELDFFLLFSSIAALIGWYGQSNYAAANAYLDGLAHALRAQGVPATSINWGIWENTGMTAVLTEQDQARWARQGLQSFSAERGSSLLAHILATAPVQTAVMPINWRRFLQERPSPLYAAFAAAAPAPAQPGAQPALLARLAAAPASKQRGVLAQFVREQAVLVLGLDSAQTIDALLPLNQLGLDSLMAVELRNALARGADLTLPATLLFDYPTIDALVSYLLGRLDVAQAGQPPIAAEPTGAADDDVARLSDEEAEALLLLELEQAEKKRDRR